MSQPRLLADRGFYLGPLFRRAADRHGAVFVTLDRPLDTHPGLGVDLDYTVLADVVEELSGRLWAAGVRPSEQVALHKTDNVDIVLLTCAISRIGAVPVLLSPGLAGPVVGQLLERLREPWLITDRAKLEGPLKGVGVRVRRTLSVDAAPGAEPLAGFTCAGPPAPVRLHPREPALITHSSGTTGVPKLAVHCPNTMWNRLVPQQAMGWPTRGETAALHMSFVHSRFYHLLGVLLRFGSPLVLITDPDPAAVRPLLVRHRPGIVETHPNTFVLWEELADAPGAPLSQVKSYGSTFDAIHPRTVRRLLGASTRRAPWLVQLYGQSETGPVAVQWFTRRSAQRADGRRVGTGIPGFTRLRITGPDGRPVAPGTPGRIEARTRGRILTYLGARAQYERQLDDGWWQMGDMGVLSRLGALRLIDREIDRIDAVHSSLEVEDALMERLEELREVVIVPGADREPVPVVCVRGERPLDPERWRAATADLPAMAEPRQWRFEELPMTATWKVKRVEITRLLTGTPRSVPA
ncbi:acyl-coenzyme A synthetase/AMP-(fatty) acid ligase [Streptomyces achromogenes]|uniref:Acyl-coenzyme A synthetase/AMP-(Fatty) acid ligase n=1 Tax=Streptomyces achromogenes TaxID=67255 RepID=A0ABU0Q7L5_STRAH|nr:class I adenylate-forming enzyme family protein [Streptomyces achromogenes]MDQ0685830.1 acyl-coenzyme A synthetase/AMP-(fatty) acid ligase [Streptomyces achromogenes]MDQ0832977.1 acyl-coenzyme A synthetase/AMP-(fatty) acid ligase [Streptomyces achromogenes]